MEQKVTVRRVTARDIELMSKSLDACSACREDYLAEMNTAVPISRQIEQRLDEGIIWVAEVEGMIVGSVSMRSEAEGLYLRSIAVRNDAQEPRIAPELLRAVNEYAEVGELEAHLVGGFYTQLVYAGTHRASYSETEIM